MKRLIVFLVIGIVSACSTLPTTFTSTNILKIHHGMGSDEILTLFGNPKSVSQGVCGSDTGPSWTCTTWEYGAYPEDTASLTFSGDDPKSLILNNFKVDRK